MKTKLFFLLSLVILSLPLVTYANFEIGVVRGDSTAFRIFSGEDGNLVDSQTLIDPLTALATHNYITTDIHDAEGTEWISYDDDNHDVTIYNQSGSLIDSFPALNDASLINVGNLSDDYPGKEIAVCKDKSTSPRITIFAYSENSSASQILSFKPFGEGHARERGCSALGIGDVDGDGENELVTFKGTQHHHDIKVKIFDARGELETSFMISNRIYAWAIDESSGQRSVYIQDVNGDGADEIIFQGDTDDIYAYNEAGDQLYKFNSNEYNDKDIKKIDVADIDGDGSAEVVVQEKGKKVPILILNSDGEVETSYNLYPDAMTSAARFMFLGDFSTEL